MNEENKYTERDLILAKRQAWVECDLEFCPSDCISDHREKSIQQAAIRYPLPPLALGKFAGRAYRLRDGVLEYRTRVQTPICGGEAERVSPLWDRASLQPEDVRRLAAALEEIEVGADS